MHINELKSVIKDVITQDDPCKSILIDGAWGCGKTTMVKNAIMELKEQDCIKRKIIYQSLFGIKDVSELSACFSYAGKIIYSLSKSIASPFTKLIPIVGEQINECVDNATSLFQPAPVQKKNVVFIFDDLERVDNSLSYISLLGFFNQLIMRGCIVICISSLNDLTSNEKKQKKDIEAFLEKAFDRVFFINESPDEIIKEIFNNDEKTKKCIDSCLNMFDCNIRLALKTRTLLNKIFNNSNKHNYDLSKKFTDLQVMKAAIIAIKASNVFSENNNVDSKKTEQEPLLFNLKTQSGHLNNGISDNINKLFKKETYYFVPEEIPDLKTLAKCFCYVNVHNNYEEMSDNYPSSIKETKNNEFDDSVFYLSDEDKKEYFLSFKNKTINKQIEINKNFVDKFIEFIRYTNFDLNEDGFVDSVISQVADAAINNNLEAFARLENHKTFSQDSTSQKLINDIYEKTFALIKSEETNRTKESINEALIEENYSYLLDLIYDVENYKRPEYVRESVKSLLLENKFFLPDLSKTIDYTKWSYCHEVAKLSKKDDALTNDFINTIKDVVKNHINSTSAIDRCKALIEYNFGGEIFKAFANYCENTKKLSKK